MISTARYWLPASRSKPNSTLILYQNARQTVYPRCSDFRRTGSAALDLAYLAAGRVDGFFEIGLKPWDFLGGELLVREAGGIVTDFTGNHRYIDSGNIVAGSPRVVRELLAELA
ncbi:Inositol-1-monophosphatase [Morganella morganii]|nr:Inositol-1-monophosphatase [Morganella morganii]